MKSSSNNRKKRPYRRKSGEKLFDDEEVKVFKYGDNLELVNRPLGKPNITRIDSDHYVDGNGELQEFSKSTNKSENLSSVAKTMKRLRRLIVNNFDGGNDQLWVTLTYAENMQDLNQLYSDFKFFIRRLRRRFGQLEYIMVIEPQARGAWHCHVLFKTADKSELYIENSELARIWGHGFVKVKRLRESDNVAAYVMAYLNDMPVSEVTGEKSKRVIKGARLYLYPSGKNFYRYSRGIEQPEVDIGYKHEIQEHYNISDSDSVFYNQREVKVDLDGSGNEVEVIFKTEIFRIGGNEDG